MDARPFPEKPADVIHHQLDLKRKKVRDVFRHAEIQAVIHLGFRHNPRGKAADQHTWNVEVLQHLFEFVQQYSVPKFVLLSSANVYGPLPDNAQFLDEDAPLLGASRFSDMRDLVEVDMITQSFFWKHPQTETVILRPAHILGTVRNAPSNYLRLAKVPTLMGFDPMMQAVHQEDVISALDRCLEPNVRGIFNIAGPPPIPLSKAIRLLGRNHVAIPYSLARFGVDRLWRMRITSFPAPELDFIRYVCMVDDRRARETLGHEPQYDITQTLNAVDAERWL